MAATVRQLQAAALFEAGGYMPSGASAMVGNCSQECGTNLSCQWRTGKLDHGSQGLVQWRLDRLTAYEDWVKAKHPDLKTQAELWPQYGRLDYQCEYAMVEMKKDYPSLDAKLRKGGDVASLTADVCWEYERPSKTLSGIANRIAQAKLVFIGTNKAAAAKSKTKLVDVNTALSLVADQHVQQRNGGVAMATLAGVTAAGGTVAHFAHGIHWWEWLVLGVLVLVGLVGILAAITEGEKAATITAAKADVNTGMDPLPPPASIIVGAKPSKPVPPPVDTAIVTQADKDRMARDRAKSSESAAINKAMAGPPDPGQNAHWIAVAEEAMSKASATATVPVMQIIRP